MGCQIKSAKGCFFKPGFSSTCLKIGTIETLSSKQKVNCEIEYNSLFFQLLARHVKFSKLQISSNMLFGFSPENFTVIPMVFQFHPSLFLPVRKPSGFLFQAELMGTPSRRELNENAIPTLFSFSKSSVKRKSSEERIEKREKRKVRRR